MKRVLSLSAYLLLSSAFAVTSQQAADAVARRVATATGAFRETCTSYSDQKRFDNIRLVASSCYTTSKSMEYAKGIIDIYYQDEMLNGWYKTSLGYENSLSIDGNLINILISPIDPEGKKGTFVMITNSDIESYLRDIKDHQDEVFSRLGLPRNTYDTGKHTKGVRYFDVMQELEAFDLNKSGSYIVVSHSGNKLLFKFNSLEAILNGKPIKLNGTPYLRANFIFLPTSVISQMGCKIVDPYFTTSTIEADCGLEMSNYISTEMNDMWQR